MEVPDTKDQIKEIVTYLVQWLKDSPIARHMDKFNRLATGATGGALPCEGDEGDEEEPLPPPPDDDEELTIRSMEDDEEFHKAMLRLLLAACEEQGAVEGQEEMIDKYIARENVPARINTLLEVCGIFDLDFWKTYMDAWLVEGGVSGVNEPPITIQLLLQVTEAMIYTVPKHAGAFKGQEHGMHIELLKQLHNYNVLMETEPGLLRDPKGGAPRSVMAALMIRTVGALCQERHVFYEITAIEMRKQQLELIPTFDISIRTIYEIFRSTVAGMLDADLLQALYKLFRTLLDICDEVEANMMPNPDPNPNPNWRWRGT